MNYRGRIVDAVSLWSEFVDFPTSFDPADGGFTPLVRCPNPDHATEKKHFQINLDKPLVHCFAECGISGTYEHAISLIEGSTQRMARKTILKHSRVGRDKVRKKTYAQREIPVQQLAYERYLPHVAMDYLKSRGVSYTSMSHWELGWNPQTLRVVIPAKDARGRLKFLIERAVRPKDQPRYLYTEGADKNRLLFGLDKIDQGMIRSTGIVLVEGSLDTIMLHQHGHVNTAALLTSKMSEFQAKAIARLRPRRIYTMFDADVAGIEAIISTNRWLRHHPIYVCRFPKGKSDPAELTKEEADRVISRAIPISKFKQMTNGLFRSQQPRKEMTRFG